MIVLHETVTVDDLVDRTAHRVVELLARNSAVHEQPDPPRRGVYVLRKAEVARRLGCSESHLDELERRGEIPRARRILIRPVGWLEHEIAGTELQLSDADRRLNTLETATRLGVSSAAVSQIDAEAEQLDRGALGDVSDDLALILETWPRRNAAGTRSAKALEEWLLSRPHRTGGAKAPPVAEALSDGGNRPRRAPSRSAGRS